MFLSRLSMFQRIALILTLLVGLLFVTQASPVLLAAGLERDGGCMDVKCSTGCCASVECCQVAQATHAPETPSQGSSQAQIQLADLGLQTFTLLFHLPAAPRSFVVSDEIRTAHQPVPRAVSCIRLI